MTDRAPTAAGRAAASVAGLAAHSPFSHPGPHRGLVAAIDPEPAAIHLAATRSIRHYRADGTPTAEQLADIDLRWMSDMLAVLDARSPGPLDRPRSDDEKLGGCCRDHSLLAVSILREHGVPARTRLGFADYFTPGFRHDHVVVEYADDGGWRRFDPELAARSRGFDVHRMPAGEGAPFETAAEAWLAYRAGRTDLAGYGVGPGEDVGGPWFVQSYVLGDLAHRQGAELLLWDGWGAMGEPDAPLGDDEVRLADEIAALTVRADAGDAGAEAELAARWGDDERLQPGGHVFMTSPSGRMERVALRT